MSCHSSNELSILLLTGDVSSGGCNGRAQVVRQDAADPFKGEMPQAWELAHGCTHCPKSTRGQQSMQAA